MNIVISPDSFKGSLSALKVGDTIGQALKEKHPDWQFDILPMADGGEGTVDALLFATNGTKVELEVTGPFGTKITSYYGVLGDNKTVVMEIANTAGLVLVGEERDPLKTTSFGLGELIGHALKEGYRDFIIGLGGSATNDGGMGLLQALGITFFNQEGEVLSPCGASLNDVYEIDSSGLEPRLKEAFFTIACDVENRLCGEQGATYIYGPQKGLKPEQLKATDRSMNNYANLVEAKLEKKVQDIPGAGAAGGLGFAFLILGAELKSGAAIVADVLGLEEKIEHADWIITGEGKSDAQTLFGKVPYYVAKLAKTYDKKTILISGSLGDGHEKLYDCFFSCHSIVSKPMSLDEAMEQAEPLLYDAALNIGSYLRLT
ncbi:glycerate kinase [Pullulanibacillus sp. KACC 23026]|uniref:glycerate kinase n=1 Tax=Pullulanibacillus sp. KACC 23026 TaxID=3028315 RepID=UPI0023B1F4D3|nr:glycerate kinase [Pullulanibacillus sp. KACC 23026]WEG13215.1 glycerate kinase [Pullulanibacillus sp. KACC 23026]